MAEQRMTPPRNWSRTSTSLGLVGLVACCLAVAAVLDRLVGPPTMLATAPNWSRVREVLNGTQLADQDAITVAAGIAWLALSYLGLTIAVRLVLSLAASLTGQARWTMAGLDITAPLTLPFVRRIVDTALAGAIVANASFLAPLSAAALNADTTVVTAQAWISPGHASAEVPPNSPSTSQPPKFSESAVPSLYRVVSGDSLWRISDVLLGDPFRWPEIWALNQQRQMADGRPFVNPSLIYPGWILEMPHDAISPTVAPAAPPAAAAVISQPAPPPATLAPEPTPVSATPTAVAPVTFGAGQAASSDGPGSRNSHFKMPLPGTSAGAGIAAITVSGAAMLLVFRRRRAGSPKAHGQEGLPAGAGDAGRVLAVTGALQAALADLDFAATTVLVVRESTRFLEFTLDCPRGDASSIVAARDALGHSLGCAVVGEAESPSRVRLKLSQMSRVATALFGESAGGRPLVVPVGASDSAIYYLNFAAIGSAVIAGGRMETRDLLTTWLATLRSFHTAEEMTIVADRAANELLDEALFQLAGVPAAEVREQTVAGIARQLEETIVRGDRASLDRPIVVAVVGPTADVRDARTELESVLRQGPAHGIFVLASTEVLPDPETQRAFGATVAFDEGGLAGASGGLTLSLARHQTLHLQPITVRWQTAQRPDIEVANPEVMSPLAPSINGQTPRADLDGPEGDDDEEEPEVERTEEDASVPDVQSGETEEPPLSVPVPAMTRQPALPLTAPGEDCPSTAAGTLLSVRLFGSFYVETTSGEVTGWTLFKARELMAYLLARGGTPVLRDNVGEALWPEADAEQTLHNLHNAVYYLRRALTQAAGKAGGQVLVTVGRQHVQLRMGLLKVDVDSFDAHLARAEQLHGAEALVEYERALAVGAGDFLSGESFEWAEVYRREYQNRFVAAAQRAAQLATNRSDPALAISFHEAILKREPLDEEVVCKVMRYYASLGNINAVKRTYTRLIAALRRELDDDKAVPMRDTTTAFRELTGQGC